MAKDSEFNTGSIYVYRLIDPTVIVKQEAKLANLLFGMRSANDGARRFRVSPISGCISFCDSDRIWKNPQRGKLPPNAQAAVKVARTFFEQKSRSLAKENLRLQARDRLPELFPINPPATLRHVSTRAVFGPSQEVADHWLSQFRVELATGTDLPTGGATQPLSESSETLPGSQAELAGNASVEGSRIDVRIGASGEVIALSSRWRPWREQLIVDRLLIPDGNVNGNGETRPTLFYGLANEEEQQDFLAPYYVSPSIINPEVWPASPYSTVLHISQQVLPSGSIRLQGAALYANDMGTRLRFTWGHWRLDSGLCGELHSHDEAASTTQNIPGGKYSVSLSNPMILEAGAYSVALVAILVRRDGSRVIARAEREIYAGINERRKEPVG
jgi:hypothetical protein